MSPDGLLRATSTRELLKVALPFLLLSFSMIWWAQEHFFFWDTVSQASRRGHWYYDQSFAHFFLPPHLDSGHPVFFNMYVAAMWKVFGKSLLISHWIMLPFHLLMWWELARLVCQFVGSLWGRYLTMGMMWLCTVWLGHSVLVSPDIVLMSGFFLAFMATLRRQQVLLFTGLLLINAVSLRGVLATAAIGATHIWWMYELHGKDWFRQVFKPAFLWPYMAIAALMLAYFTMHYWATGWWISTPNEAWAHHRESVGISGVVWNVGILGWRLLDFGFAGYWVVLAVLLSRWKKIKSLNRLRLLLLATCFTLLAYGTPMVLFQNPIGHRYLLPVMFLLLLALAHAVLEEKRLPVWSLLLALVLNISGWFWVYPRNIAQGWDATPAHWPYYQLRLEMLDFMEDESIPLQTVGTQFPNIGPREMIDLNDELTGMKEADLHTDLYIFYSNVMNDFSDKELEILERWTVRKALRRRGVEVILYERPQ